MDPSFLLINWNAVAPVAVVGWNLPQGFVGVNLPVNVPNAPNLYTVPNRDSVHVLVGVITTQFAGVRVFAWDLAGPIDNYIRELS